MSKDTSPEEIYQNMLEGLEVGIKDRQRALTAQVESLSQKQMIRSLKEIINYPQESPELSDRSERERNFIASFVALHEMQVQLEIQAIGQLQEEFELQKKLRKGEKNE